MLKFSQYSLIVGLAFVVLAMISYIVAFANGRTTREQVVRTPERVRVGAAGVEDADVASTGPAAPAARKSQPRSMAGYGTSFARLGLLFVTACMVLRGFAVGHGPFTNQYEFAVAFGWGIVAAYVYFEYRYHVRTLALLVMPIAGAMLLYALTQNATSNPLVPALQNNLLLTVHVVVAIFAYGAFAVSFAAAVLYLVQDYFRPETGIQGLPKPEVLDRLGYRAVIIGFPLLTMVVVLGAAWAQIAWGSYWSWDPKETASLVTWLVYGGYLHARVARGWVGRRAAWLLVLGFASVALTFFGNMFFGGLHSYGQG